MGQQGGKGATRMKAKATTIARWLEQGGRQREGDGEGCFGISKNTIEILYSNCIYTIYSFKGNGGKKPPAKAIPKSVRLPPGGAC